MKRPAVVAGLVASCLVAWAIAHADPIHEAAGAGRVEKLRQIIAKGVDVNAKSPSGATPLHDAATWGHRDIAELLLSKGADVDAKDNNGMTPLHLAANGDHGNLAALLIAKGASVDARAANGWGPLHVAAAWGHTNAARALVAGGADVNARAAEGTKLRAVEGAGKCHKDITALSAKKGMDALAGGGTGPTPLRIAVLNGQKEIAEFLGKHGARE